MRPSSRRSIILIKRFSQSSIKPFNFLVKLILSSGCKKTHALAVARIAQSLATKLERRSRVSNPHCSAFADGGSWSAWGGERLATTQYRAGAPGAGTHPTVTDEHFLRLAYSCTSGKGGSSGSGNRERYCVARA